jgi:hypothetical protein
MANEQPKRAVTISREDLYKQVWEKPMRRLAADYGISGNGLAKICDRLNVPYPPRGYWARKAAGQKVVQFRLPNPTDDTPGEVTITPTPPPPPPLRLPPEVADQLTVARAKIKEVTVPDRLSSRPHAIIAGWIAERRRRREEARLDPWRSPSDYRFTEVEQRRHRILDTLFKALERHGFKAKLGDRHELYLEIERERVDFDLRERKKQVRRPLTAEEKRSPYASPRGFVQEMQLTGELILSLKTHLVDGVKHEWRDGEQPLEAQVPDIISLILLAGPILKERRRQYEEAEARRREEEHRRYEEKERRKTDANQWRRFVEIAEFWRDLEVARQFLSALEAKSFADDFTVKDRSLADWLAWAHEKVEASDPLVMGAERIFNDIGQVTSWTYHD